jgi:hypothetical protein
VEKSSSQQGKIWIPAGMTISLPSTDCRSAVHSREKSVNNMEKSVNSRPAGSQIVVLLFTEYPISPRFTDWILLLTAGKSLRATERTHAMVFSQNPQAPFPKSPKLPMCMISGEKGELFS